MDCFKKNLISFMHIWIFGFIKYSPNMDIPGIILKTPDSRMENVQPTISHQATRVFENFPVPQSNYQKTFSKIPNVDIFLITREKLKKYSFQTCPTIIFEPLPFHLLNPSSQICQRTPMNLIDKSIFRNLKTITNSSALKSMSPRPGPQQQNASQFNNKSKRKFHQNEKDIPSINHCFPALNQEFIKTPPNPNTLTIKAQSLSQSKNPLSSLHLTCSFQENSKIAFSTQGKLSLLCIQET